jgi:hypothetical protein
VQVPLPKWQAVSSVLHASAVKPHSQMFDPTREAERLVPKRRYEDRQGQRWRRMYEDVLTA